MKSRERIESAISDLKTKTDEYEKMGRRLLDVAGELELAAMGVFEQARGTTGRIAGEFRDDFGQKSESDESLKGRTEYSAKETEGDEFDHWLNSHKEEVRHMVCDSPEYEKADFCH